ncbi:MAG: dienelactone hydrolase family protein [Xanthomonadales bacterium]|nr:dienelactone hydrolase family protein [Xanthomonadales bacterium]
MIKTTTIDYAHGGIGLEAYVAWDESSAGARPAVLIAHMWAGRVEFCCQWARDMARAGYVGFALDLYGKGVIGSSIEENRRLMQPLIDDRGLLQERMNLAFETAAGLPQVDRTRIAAIGFCFGGLCVLDLARCNRELAAAVSFHGLLGAPDNLEPDRITARILVLHGDADPLVAAEEPDALRRELTQCEADWQFIHFGHAVHAFTNPQANDPDFGTVYDERTDRRARRYAAEFLDEVFAEVRDEAP